MKYLMTIQPKRLLLILLILFILGVFLLTFSHFADLKADGHPPINNVIGMLGLICLITFIVIFIYVGKETTEYSNENY